MKNLKSKIILIILAVSLIGLLGGCGNNEEKTITVHKKFVHPDSLEISVELFLAIASDKQLKVSDVLEYLDKAGVEYKMSDNSNGYKWYDVYANNKEHHIGFARGRMFSYWER